MTWPGMEPRRSGVMPASNRLSYGASIWDVNSTTADVKWLEAKWSFVEYIRQRVLLGASFKFNFCFKS
jgi:hypothetical protein